jgi:hypothetical protein
MGNMLLVGEIPPRLNTEGFTFISTRSITASTFEVLNVWWTMYAQEP